MRREKRKERERGRESLCRLNILTDESPLAMLRMEIVGPDSAVTARRQIINFSLDAKRIPLSVCSPPPSTVCLPFFLPLSFHPSACPFRDVYLISRNGKILAACSRRSWQAGRGSRPCSPLLFQFFFFLPLLSCFSNIIFTATHAWTQDFHTIIPVFRCILPRFFVFFRFLSPSLEGINFLRLEVAAPRHGVRS